MVGAPSWRIGGSLVHSLQLTASGGARGFGKAQSIRGKGWLCSAQNTRKQQKLGPSSTLWSRSPAARYLCSMPLSSFRFPREQKLPEHQRETITCVRF